MKRKDWLFRYTAGELAEAAKAKREFHDGRLKWWEGKKQETMKNVRENGIEVHDSVGAQYGSYSNKTSGYGAEIQVDAGMQRDLNECTAKIAQHLELVKQYSGWIQVFGSQLSTSTLELDHDDYLFFFEK